MENRRRNIVPGRSQRYQLMTRKEFADLINQIDPESPTAMDDLAALFERDYQEAGRDLTDPDVTEELKTAAEAELQHHISRYDDLLEKINRELRKAGATEAQINWGLFGDVELPTLAYLHCSQMAKKLIRHSYQITYCLGELKLLSKYSADVDTEELERIRREYRRRFG